MPQHKSAIKRVRQSETRRVRNVQKRSKMKTAIKKVRTASDKENATAELKNTIRILDRLVLKGLIHKNKASNMKSKLSRLVNQMK
jgi:small subunit ribosomal protein S20